MTKTRVVSITNNFTNNIRQNVSVDWSQRKSVRAKLRLMVKRILRKYRYPSDQQEEAIHTVLQQAEILLVLNGHSYFVQDAWNILWMLSLGKRGCN